MIEPPECRNTGRSNPVTPSIVIDRDFWPNLHAINGATVTCKSARFILEFGKLYCHY